MNPPQHTAPPTTTYRIHLRGRVQGVGFRPYVYRLARAHQLSGWVNNGPDGVHVCINASHEAATRFYEALVAQAPALAYITQGRLEESQPMFFDSFSIIHSGAEGTTDLLITPDLAMCPLCRAELLDPHNRRSGYAFITCTYCGPRYSILQGLPYDREQTTMAPFDLCPACAAEYADVEDRRYFSQTNSCQACGLALRAYEASSQQEVPQPEALNRAIKALKEGHIVAVKGIGGFLLLCDATSAAVVAKLRQRKQRPSKPFAVLYPNWAQLKADLVVSAAEELQLNSAEAPIVLLSLKPAQASGLALEQVAPGLNQIGAMLPYAPLLELLSGAVGRPLVATSANLSNSPIVFDDQEAVSLLAGTVADYVLTHNRAISMPQDDSVVRLSPGTQSLIYMRRSRGLAPSYRTESLDVPQERVFCAGADLKSTFTYTHQGNVYISQYLGDLDHFDTQQRYKQVANQLLKLIGERPSRVVADKHPTYFSSALARELAASWGTSPLWIQHHEAHFWAVLAENRLLDTPEPVLGVIWDGVGYGNDGQIWGGEYFVYQQGTMKRQAHWSYFPVLAADKMSREPRLSALALTAGHLPEADGLLEPLFAPAHWQLYQQLARKPAQVQTSSMGRLFDAVAALLGLAEVCSYEGEAALRLEQAAQAAPDEQGFWPLPIAPDGVVDSRALLSAMMADQRAGLGTAQLAARFHLSLVENIRQVASLLQLKSIACSGGVWQNALLVDLMKTRLATDFKLYFHQQLSPNDECVSFGQLFASRYKN